MDVRELEFLDSSGIGVLVRAHAALSAEQRSLDIVVAASSPVERALVVSGVDGLLEISVS